MSDNLKRYCAILVALKQAYPQEPAGNLARHLNTLAALVCGIVGSKKCHLPAAAGKVPGGSSPKGGKRESRVKRFARFLQNKAVTPEALFLPYARALVESLPPGPLVLVMDGSVIGRGCMALMVSVLYHQGGLRRALPLCWRVTKAPKGHFPQESHRELLAQARGLIPAGRQVVFLGDGEFALRTFSSTAAIYSETWRQRAGTSSAARRGTCGWPRRTVPRRRSHSGT